RAAAAGRRRRSSKGKRLMVSRVLLRSVVFPLVELFTKSRFWSFYQQSLRFDRSEGPARAKVRDHRLGALLHKALNSSLHQERLRRAGPPAAAPHGGRAPDGAGRPGPGRQGGVPPPPPPGGAPPPPPPP